MNIGDPGSTMRRYKSLDDYKRANETLNRLLDKERNEREKIDSVALKYLRRVKDDYETKIMNLKDELKMLREESGGVTKKEFQSVKFDLLMARKDINKQKASIEFLRERKKKAEDDLKVIQTTLSDKEKEVDTWKAKCDALTANLETVEKERKECYEKCKDLEEQKKKLSEENKKLSKANEMLKSTCSKIETQVMQFESSLNLQFDIQFKLTEEKKQMLEKVENLKAELESIKNKYQNQIMDMSRTIDQLESKAADYQTKCQQLETDLKETKESLEEEKQFRRLHCDEIPSLLKENELKQQTIETLNYKLTNNESELNCLKEETAGHITTIAQLNTQNKQLSQALEEALIKNDTLQRRIDVIVTEMEEEKNKYEFEKLKFNETINQQLKLIDLLQDKMEKPKKSWFGHTNSPGKEPGPTIRMMQVREIEAALEREKTKNKMLAMQIDETKQELRRYKNEIRKYEKRGYHAPNNGGKGGDNPSQVTPSPQSKYSKQIEVEITPSISTTPSAPRHHEIDITSSSASTSTTDNNDTSEEEKEFTFTDSILAELGERKVSNLV